MHSSRSTIIPQYEPRHPSLPRNLQSNIYTSNQFITISPCATRDYRSSRPLQAMEIIVRNK
jgi:hypothetical protein